MIPVLVIIFGLIVGSFLSVCIYRIPRAESFYIEVEEGETPQQEIPEPVGFNEPKRSICLKCGKQLLWWHNIPLFSWLILRGKCWFCKTPISARYPVVELLSAMMAILSYHHYGLTPTGAVVYLFCAALIVISFIDFDYYIIPDVISISGTVVGIVIAGANSFTHYFDPPVVPNYYFCALGLLAGAGFLYLISEVYLKLRRIEGLGLGDVKLLAMTGALFGPECALYTIFIGSLFGSIIGLALVLFHGREFNKHLPFGPYLAVGSVLYLFVGLDVVYFITDSFARGLTLMFH
jgi:leader peptidase (prepilin peptidase)/N-methyltransferase